MQNKTIVIYCGVFFFFQNLFLSVIKKAIKLRVSVRSYEIHFNFGRWLEHPEESTPIVYIALPKTSLNKFLRQEDEESFIWPEGNVGEGIRFWYKKFFG